MGLLHRLKYFLKYVALNPKKVFNIILIKFSKTLKFKKVLGYPLTLMVEPTNICNLKCPLCPTGRGLIKRPKGFLNLNNFMK